LTRVVCAKDNERMDLITVNDHQNVSWIETLALEEVNMEESGIIRFNDHLTTQHLLEESSLNFVNKLKDRFEFYVSLFNQYRANRDTSRTIKVYRVSNTINDFMLFRNSLRLIVARKAPDLINIGFLTTTAPRMAGEHGPAVHGIYDIKAHVGPFNNISWRYQGEVVEVEALVKFYLTEFIKNSSR
jgi:hypothetical protein